MFENKKVKFKFENITMIFTIKEVENDIYFYNVDKNNYFNIIKAEKLFGSYYVSIGGNSYENDCYIKAVYVLIKSLLSD